jgi:hypothetical protein
MGGLLQVLIVEVCVEEAGGQLALTRLPIVPASLTLIYLKTENISEEQFGQECNSFT